MAAIQDSPKVLLHTPKVAEVPEGQRKSMAHAFNQLGVTEWTFFGWRNEFDGGAVIGHPRAVSP